MWEDKLFKLVVVIVVCTSLIILGTMMIRFMPVILKGLGFVVNVGSICMFIKYLRSGKDTKNKDDDK